MKLKAQEVAMWVKRSVDFLRPYKISMHNHRKMVYGDLGLVGTELLLRDINDRPEERAAFGGDLFPDVHQQEYELARSNYLMEQVWTLMKQCAYQVPDIEVTGVHEDEEAFMREYLKVRLSNSPRGCNAARSMKLALWDCLVSGVGFVGIGCKYDRPYIEYHDWRRVVWDPFASTFNDSKRIAVLSRMEVWRAVEIWGSAKFEDLLDDDKLPLKPRETVEIAYYYDCRDDEGFYGVFRADRITHTDIEWLESGPNPFFSEIDGYRQARLPVIEVELFNLPGSTCPVSLTQMMAPAQAMLATLEQRLYNQNNASAGFWDIDAAAYDPSELEKFSTGKTGEQVMRKTGSPPQWISGGEIQQMTIYLLNMYKQQLMGSGGANPYATGNKVEGVNYAAEVNAIQANANLTAMNVSKCHAEHWVRVAQAFLDYAVHIEESPLALPMGNDQIVINQGRDTFLRDLVNLTGTFQVAESTVMFENRQQRLDEAIQAFQLAIQAAAIAPGSAALAYRKVLAALGTRSIDAHFEMPQLANMNPAAVGATTEGN